MDQIPDEILKNPIPPLKKFQQLSDCFKYQWANVPEWVNWLATDYLGIGGFAVKPKYSPELQGWTSWGQGMSACLVLTAPNCAFEDSLEQRPAAKAGES